MLALFEDPPVNKFNGFAESVVTQTTEETDNNGQNDQKGIFTDAKRALQRDQGQAQTLKELFLGKKA